MCVLYIYNQREISGFPCQKVMTRKRFPDEQREERSQLYPCRFGKFCTQTNSQIYMDITTI